MRRTAKLLTLALFGGALILTLETLWSPQRYARRQSAVAKLDKLEQQNEKLSREIEGLKARIRAHRKRPEVRARAVRDELNYVEARDVVLDFREEPN